jgi:hypothetical protein
MDHDGETSEAQGDGRSIENPEANPTDPSDMPDELEEAVRSDVGEQPVSGERPGDGGAGGEPGDGDDGSAGDEPERVSEPGEGLVTEEGVNEPGTKADTAPPDSRAST